MLEDGEVDPIISFIQIHADTEVLSYQTLSKFDHTLGPIF